MNEHEDITILLVDDDEGHAELAKINLERSGLINEMVHFSSGQKLLDFLYRDAPERKDRRYLIVLDINMPGLDGHGVLSRIKGDRCTAHIPVIVLSTAEGEKEVERCYALGCNLYMTKPMAYEDFCDAMRELGLFIRKTRIPAAVKIFA